MPLFSTRVYVLPTYCLGVVFGPQEQLWSSVPEGDHHRVEVGQRLEGGVE